MSNGPGPKPGIRTTEFWTNAIVQVAGLLLATGTVGGDVRNTAERLVDPQTTGILVMVASQVVYTISRIFAKRQ